MSSDRLRIRNFYALWLLAVVCTVCGVAPAHAALKPVAIDMRFYHPGSQAGGLSASPLMGDLPTILLYDLQSGTWDIQAFLLDKDSGKRKSGTMHVDPGVPCVPVDLIWSSQFLAGGILVICSDLTLTGIPVIMLPDGTPQPGSAMNLPMGDAQTLGSGTCLCEMPGAAFNDLHPRLVVGTDLGRVLVIELVNGQPQVTQVFQVGAQPVSAVGPIPQLNYLALGAVCNDRLVGIDLEPGAAASGAQAASSPTVIFSLAEPRPDPLLDFAVFEPNDQPLSDPSATVAVALANGTNVVGMTTLASAMTGLGELKVGLAEPRPDPVWQLVLGSLLTLSMAGDVQYQAGFDTSGALDCTYEILNPAYLVGDLDLSTTISSADVIQLVNYVFKGGAAPCPGYVGDVNCSSNTTASDIIHLVNHVFKGGPPPCTP